MGELVSQSSLIILAVGDGNLRKMQYEGSTLVAIAKDLSYHWQTAQAVLLACSLCRQLGGAVEL